MAHVKVEMWAVGYVSSCIVPGGVCALSAVFDGRQYQLKTFAVERRARGTEEI